jgi:hypothetical protein
MKSFWFISGFAFGLVGITLVQAAMPKRVTPVAVTEIKSPKVTAPDLEADFDRLQKAEARYAESWDQQQRIRAASQNSRSKKPVQKSRQ